MDKIQLLPDTVANQIAAGEVIQRPASVIKELVENAVDAGARRIDVLVTNAGRSTIQVIDDGCGMSITDARLAFERHATSKIRCAKDLFSLHTMGFRGEALPSVAAVAQVTLKTCRAEDSLGTVLRIDGGRLVSQQPDVCTKGSNFIVENLFFNVPVRRRFLKTNVTELNNIIAAFQRVALVYPDIMFTLTSNGTELMSLPAANQLRRIVDVFGKKLNADLLPVDVDTSLGKITGYVGKPEASHKKGVLQYFFVNGRYMRHPAFHKAVMSAYERLVPQGEQVPYFIYFNVSPEDIDVNIHPTKTEIKFQDEQAVWQILAAAVRETVGKFSTIPSIDFDTEGKPDIPVFTGTETVEAPPATLNPQYNPFKSAVAAPRHSVPADGDIIEGRTLDDTLPPPPPKPSVAGWETLYEGLAKPAADAATLFASDEAGQETAADTEARATEHYQYKGAYILTSVASGLMVTDQQRAHERILYERYLRDMAGHGLTQQPLLFPEVVQFTVGEMVSLPDILPIMESMGFELTNLGSGSYAINSIPAGLDGVSAPRLVSDMVASASDTEASASDTLRSALAASMAHDAALPHGQALTSDEMEDIIKALLACENTRYTPSGKPVYTIVPHSALIKSL